MEKIQQTHLDRRFRLLGFVLLQCFVSRILAVGDEDLITDLPGVTFDYDFKQYSGYLNANSDGTHRLFYWLTESANSPDTDPLLIWFNGGKGLLSEYGPFNIGKDGRSLNENVYAWNKQFNMLFIESPLGTGFSYDTNDPDTLLAGDDETAVQRKFLSRTFFVAGESYAAIYITTLSNLIFQSIARRQFPNSNFQGIAIGNGYLNAKNLTNSLVHWHLYHGTIGVRQWEDIRNGCCRGIKRIEDCDFSAHIAENTTDTWPLTDCGRLFVDAMIVPDNQNAYNWYQDCYEVDPKSTASKLTSKNRQIANYFNYDSTDNQNGFNCWNEQAMAIYLNRPDVQKALHISSHWMSNENTQWELCNDDLNDNYHQKYNDTFYQFQDIFRHVKQLEGVIPPNWRILIFNGDADTVCNFIGAAWFTENLAQKERMAASKRVAWRFRNQLAGFFQPYKLTISRGNTLTLDVLTIKAAGHFANDRPGPALQMITNFVRGSGNYSDDRHIDVSPQPRDLKSNAQSANYFTIFPLLCLSSLVVF
ncbi:Peptidase S10 domain containing protein [Aphelenchoides besseyi]|nr:Peptidase S10 domain containing protein [Aphelenchoides besseyi]